MNNKFIFNDCCNKLLDKWKCKEINNPNLLVVQPANKGVAAYEFIEMLAHAYIDCNIENRNFTSSFLLLRFPKKENERKMFFDSPTVAAAKYDMFKGVFAIEISEYWISQIDSPEFDELLDFVERTSDAIKYIFIVATNQNTRLNELYRKIRNRIRLEMVEMSYLDAGRYIKFISDEADEKAIDMSWAAENQLRCIVEEICETEAFAGYDTAVDIIDELVYLQQKKHKKSLAVDDIKELKEVRETVPEIRTNKIGF